MEKGWEAGQKARHLPRPVKWAIIGPEPPFRPWPRVTHVENRVSDVGRMWLSIAPYAILSLVAFLPTTGSLFTTFPGAIARLVVSDQDLPVSLVSWLVGSHLEAQGSGRFGETCPSQHPKPSPSDRCGRGSKAAQIRQPWLDMHCDGRSKRIQTLTRKLVRGLCITIHDESREMGRSPAEEEDGRGLGRGCASLEDRGRYLYSS